MFHIEMRQIEGRSHPMGIVVDAERHATLEVVEFVSAELLWIMKLVVESATIPFTNRNEEIKDPATDDTYFITRFDSFGSTTLLQYSHGILPYRFKDAAEKSLLQMLAVEGLLVFGSFYNGDQQPNGKYRIELNGRLYTKNDFGMSL